MRWAVIFGLAALCAAPAPPVCCDGSEPSGGTPGEPPTCDDGAEAVVDPEECDGGSGNGGACATDGSSASYAETIGESGGVATRTIATSTCPNHESMCTGKPIGGVCGDVGENGSGTEAKDQGITKVVPAEPVLKATYAADDTKCVTGAIAYALNGVSIFSGAVDNECGILDVTDQEAEWGSFDCCSGHAENSGVYHYHFPPSCLLAQLAPFADGHSPQIGWSFDGFPIYGPLGPGGVEIRNCGASGADDEYCQDECGGYKGKVDGVDNFKYRYYFTGKVGDLDSLPGDPKPDDPALYEPFTINCYRGCTYDELAAGACEGSSGTTSKYEAAPLDGVVDALGVRCLDGETYYGGAGEAPACGDSTSWWYKKDSRDCDFVAKKAKRCKSKNVDDAGVSPLNACPATCASGCACADSTSWYAKKPSRDCAYVAKKTKRCSKKDENKVKGFDACPVTCEREDCE